jgi:hypothetical protein
MEPDNNNKEYQKMITFQIDSQKVVPLKDQACLILIILILKKYSRIFHHFLFSPVFLIFIILKQKSHKITYKNTKIKMETIFKDTLVNIVNQNNVNQILKIINT